MARISLRESHPHNELPPLSVALIHMVTRPMPNTPVIWIDGGYNTTATQEFARLLEGKLDLNLDVYRPKPGQQAMSGQSRVPRHGSSSYERFVERIKLEPFRWTLDPWRPDYWVTGIRADQTAYRRSLEVLSKGPQGVVRVAPFLRWTEVDVEGYIYNNGLADYDDYVDPTKPSAERECGLQTVA